MGEGRPAVRSKDLPTFPWNRFLTLLWFRIIGIYGAVLEIAMSKTKVHRTWLRGFASRENFQSQFQLCLWTFSQEKTLFEFWTTPVFKAFLFVNLCNKYVSSVHCSERVDRRDGSATITRRDRKWNSIQCRSGERSTWMSASSKQSFIRHCRLSQPNMTKFHDENYPAQVIFRVGVATQQKSCCDTVLRSIFSYTQKLL